MQVKGRVFKINIYLFRESENVITDLENKIDKTLEELAIVQTELEDNKNKSQEQMERLKQKLNGMKIQMILKTPKKKRKL